MGAKRETSKNIRLKRKPRSLLRKKKECYRRRLEGLSGGEERAKDRNNDLKLYPAGRDRKRREDLKVVGAH